MMTDGQPTILIVDDDISHARALANELRGSQVHPIPILPDEIDLNLLLSAQLVIVDHRLDNWPERDGLQNPAFRAMDGLALIEVLRSHVKEEESQSSPSPGFVLWSGDQEAFPNVDLRYGKRPDHLIARLTNLDWFVLKGGDMHSRRRTLVALAEGFAALPVVWTEPSQPSLYKVLALGSSEDWELSAREDVSACFAPFHGTLAHVAKRHSEATPIVRWLLHRILPYPTCLWPLEYVAAYLRLEVPVLRDLIGQSQTDLAKQLDRVLYKGAFQSLHGPRWWKAGVAEMLWQLTDGNPFTAEAVNEAVGDAGNLSHGLLGGPQVTPILNEQFDPTDELMSVDDVVRVQLDEWPAYATLPSVRITLIEENPDLRDYVVDDDRGRLPVVP